jgi:hypothetical protein
VYDWLSRLSDLRRAVEQGYKASQRLAALPELSGQAEEVRPSRWATRNGRWRCIAGHGIGRVSG